MHARARPHVRHHLAETLDGFLGQFFACLREGAGAGDGGLGFEFGGLHDLVANEALVRLVRHSGLGDFTAQAHGALAGFAHDILVGLEVTPERNALIIVQVAEQLLRVELALGLAALAFAGTEVATVAVPRTGFATRSVIPADTTLAGFSALWFAALVVTGTELAAWGALAVSGAFLALAFGRAFFAGTLITGTLLSGAGIGQGREGKPA